MSSQLEEEFEVKKAGQGRSSLNQVLESIYPTELTSEFPVHLRIRNSKDWIIYKELSPTKIEIAVEPEEKVPDMDQLKVLLQVEYPESYPDEIPGLSLCAVDGTLEDNEVGHLIEDLKTTATENLGIAMTFTLISQLREKLLERLQARADELKRVTLETERLELETDKAEEARTRGTPVTNESFMTWKIKFDKEMGLRRAVEQEERLKALPPKEREEIRKTSGRFTGRQLFERDKTLATSDASLVEEGTVSIDISQYERASVVEETETEMGLQFSDSE